jgi:hypothetical protein
VWVEIVRVGRVDWYDVSICELKEGWVTEQTLYLIMSKNTRPAQVNLTE